MRLIVISALNSDFYLARTNRWCGVGVELELMFVKEGGIGETVGIFLVNKTMIGFTPNILLIA